MLTCEGPGKTLALKALQRRGRLQRRAGPRSSKRSTLSLLRDKLASQLAFLFKIPV